ncbi:unnamed protein product [Ixodes persulcatus]
MSQQIGKPNKTSGMWLFKQVSHQKPHHGSSMRFCMRRVWTGGLNEQTRGSISSASLSRASVGSSRDARASRDAYKWELQNAGPNRRSNRQIVSSTDHFIDSSG